MDCLMNLRTLDLNLLRVFDAVYGAGSVSTAARLLGMSQPKVSASLARLRETFDDPLFERVRDGVMPTPRADEIAQPIREGLALVDMAADLPEEFDPGDAEGTTAIGLTELAEPLLMRGLLPVIRESAPNLCLFLRDLSDQDIATGLYDGSLDMAIHDQPIEGRQIHCEMLLRSPLVCAAREGWSARHGPVTRERFAELPFIDLKTRQRAHKKLDRSLAAQGCSRRLVYQTGGYWSMAGLIAGTDMLAVLPKVFFDEVSATFSLEEIDMPFDVPREEAYLIWHARNDDDAMLEWLRGVCRTIYRDGIEPFEGGIRDG